MDRLLLHQLISSLTKSPDAIEFDKVCNLFDRLLTLSNDSALLGQVLWYCCKHGNEQAATFVLNRLVEKSGTWNIASVINCAHTPDCTTPLHLAASSVVHLAESLVQLGGDVWRANARGQVAFHFAIKQLKSNPSSSRVLEIIRTLCQRMAMHSKVVELFRKFAIMPSAIEANNCAILEIITEQCGIVFDYRLYFEYLEYALQLMANSDVTDYLLCQLTKSKSGPNAESSLLSPVDLSLQYNNLPAMLKSIQLGFNCSSRIFNNGFALLKKTLISERQTEQFPVANECFQYLIQQFCQTMKNASNSKSLEVLHDFLTYKLSFKLLHRINESEVVIKGNYLTYALLNHCGSMGRGLAQMSIGAQFEVENNMLRYYRFLRHDEPLIRFLIEEHRLNFGFGRNKMGQYFQQNCHPLYDATINDTSPDGDIIANNEYAQDKIRFQHFLRWLNHYFSEPRPLSILTRNVIINRFWSASNGVGNDECPNCHSSLQNTKIIAEKIYFVQKYLGESLFDLIFRNRL